MKLISLTLSLLFVLVFIFSCTSSASNASNVQNSNANDKDEISKIEDHLSKFKSYFRVHTSKQHEEHKEDFEEAEFLVKEQKAKAKAAAKAAKLAEKNAAKSMERHAEKGLEKDNTPTVAVTPES